jgi:Xaa-Pro aminopeptidase
VDDETNRAARLLDAQAKAEHLFDEVARRGLITAGVAEKALSDQIRNLAHELFGIRRFWHKRIVRAGPNTLFPYRDNPPDRIIVADDIVFCDFGPIFEQWEADFGRTFVLGDDPVKHRLRDDLPAVFDAGRRYFHAHPDVTGAQLFDEMRRLSERAGWEFGGPHAGHEVGEFPHERINGDQIGNYITTGSDEPMRRRDRAGRLCHWILEVHLVDRNRGFGGFYEELLDLGTARWPRSSGPAV